MLAYDCIQLFESRMRHQWWRVRRSQIAWGFIPRRKDETACLLQAGAPFFRGLVGYLMRGSALASG